MMLKYNNKSFYSALGVCTMVLFFSFLSVIHSVSAHEVYVLTPPEIAGAVDSLSPNPLSSITTNMGEFLKWGIGILIAFLITLRISLWRSLQLKVSPTLLRIKKYAPFIERITIGVSLIASAYAQSLFGPELDLTFLGLTHIHILQILQYVTGVLVLFGFLTRICGIILALLYVVAMMHFGVYLFTYFNYFATAVLLILVGGGMYSIDQKINKRSGEAQDSSHDFAFFLLRVFYGIGLIYAAFYAKLIHSNLALDTVINYHLTNYFPFDPLFLVLGAFLVETVIALCIIFGFQLRLALIVFMFFLTSSIIFFGESVWPHIILFGLNTAIFVHGYDRFTLLKRFSKEGLEPVL